MQPAQHTHKHGLAIRSRKHTLAISAVTGLVGFASLAFFVTCNTTTTSLLTNKENLTRCADRALEKAMNIKTRSNKPARLGNSQR